MSTESNDKSNELQVSVHLAEYDSLRSEILHHINMQFQLPIWSLGSASIAIPLLLTQISTITMEGVAGVLYGITIVYSGIIMIYVASTFAVFRISSYISNSLEPKLSRITNSKPNETILHWESFVKEDRKTFLNIALELIGPVGILIILLMPGATSLIATYYIPASGSITTPSNTYLFWLNILSIVALISYVISILAIILISIHGAKYGVKRQSIYRTLPAARKKGR